MCPCLTHVLFLLRIEAHKAALCQIRPLASPRLFIGSGSPQPCPTQDSICSLLPSRQVFCQSFSNCHMLSPAIVPSSQVLQTLAGSCPTGSALLEVELPGLNLCHSASQACSCSPSPAQAAAWRRWKGGSRPHAFILVSYRSSPFHQCH